MDKTKPQIKRLLLELSLKELKEIAKGNDIQKYYSMDNQQLVDILCEAIESEKKVN